MRRGLNSLAARFALGFGLVLVCSLALTWSSRARQRRAFVSIATQQVDSEARKLARSVDTLLELREREVRLLAGSPTLQHALTAGASLDAARQRLEEARRALPEVINLCILDHQRGLVLSLRADCPAAEPGVRFAGREEITEEVVVPLGDGGGVLAARIRPRMVAAQLGAGDVVGAPLTSFLATAGGRVLLSSSASPAATGDRFSDWTSDAGAVRVRHPVGTRGLFVHSELPLSGLDDAWLKDSSELLLGAALLVGLFGAALTWMARSTRRPLIRLAGSAQALAARQFDVRVPVEGPTEVRDLAAAVNQMAAELQHLYGNLDQEVRERSGELMRALDRARELQAVAEAQSEELQAQNEELHSQAAELSLRQHTFNHQNEMLAEKNRELEHASRMKSEFVANMSHELRTPLNAVLGFSELLSQDFGGALSAEQREYVTDIHKAGQHLLAMINDILDLAKIEAGKMNLANETLSLGLPVREAEQMVRALAVRKRVRLEVVVDPAVHVAGDPIRLRQVALNLLSNALKFTPRGGAIHVAARRSADGRWAELVVADTGIGIAPAHHQTIFEAFRQVDGSVSRNFEGTGLGLTLVRRFVTAMDGVVGVESRPGEGATFTIRFPLSEVEAHPVPAPAPAPAAPGARVRAVVVEDDAPVRELLRKLLHSRGHQVRAADGGAAALLLLEQELPDVVVLDLMMPGMDGFELLAALRTLPGGEEVPVLVLSAKDPWGPEAERLSALGAQWALKGSMHSTQFVDRVVSLAAGRVGRAA